MAIIVITEDATKLLEQIKKAIEDGDVKTWKLSSSKRHFTHTSPQWSKQAWFKPAVMGGGLLVFNILKPSGSTSMPIDIYAEYHAFLIRMLLARFDNNFSSAQITALADVGDVVDEEEND